jgi:uncharacterized membrane protein YtjA (UPF0391 family)
VEWGVDPIAALPGKMEVKVERKATMLYWAVVFFVIALVAGILGFTGIAAGAAQIAQVLFVVFLIIFLVSLVLGLSRRSRA